MKKSYIRHTKFTKGKSIYMSKETIESKELISKEQGKLVLHNVLQKIQKIRENNKGHGMLDSC